VAMDAQDVSAPAMVVVAAKAVAVAAKVAAKAVAVAAVIPPAVAAVAAVAPTAPALNEGIGDC